MTTVNEYDGALHIMGIIDFGQVLESKDDILIYRWKRMDPKNEHYATCEGCGRDWDDAKTPYYWSFPLHTTDRFDSGVAFCWSCVDGILNMGDKDFLAGLMYSGTEGDSKTWTQIRKDW